MQLFKNNPIELYLKEHMPWVLFMTWRDLFFLSWKLPVDVVRQHLPEGLELDTFNGEAWVSMVPMRVSDIHWRGCPAIPGMDSLVELNLRTYVKGKDRAGVYFFSIDCPSIINDFVARGFFGVPYVAAQIATHQEGSSYYFASERTQSGWPAASFQAKLTAEETVSSPSPGSLEHFLLERYSLYFVQNGTVKRGDIEHQEWNVQPAAAEVLLNSVPSAFGLTGIDPQIPDHIVFVKSTDTLIFPPCND